MRYPTMPARLSPPPMSDCGFTSTGSLAANIPSSGVPTSETSTCVPVLVVDPTVICTVALTGCSAASACSKVSPMRYLLNGISSRYVLDCHVHRERCLRSGAVRVDDSEVSVRRDEERHLGLTRRDGRCCSNSHPSCPAVGRLLESERLGTSGLVRLELDVEPEAAVVRGGTWPEGCRGAEENDGFRVARQRRAGVGDSCLVVRAHCWSSLGSAFASFSLSRLLPLFLLVFVYRHVLLAIVEVLAGIVCPASSGSATAHIEQLASWVLQERLLHLAEKRRRLADVGVA